MTVGNETGGLAVDTLFCIYGSVSAGPEKWPFNVLFFKSRASV